MKNIDENPRVTSAKGIPFTLGSTTAKSNACTNAATTRPRSVAPIPHSSDLSMMPEPYAPTAKNIAWPKDKSPVTPRIKS